MKHLILGTAGHVDHGKTALVKALTGIDCDTHKEEKRRGITINLGFAHCALPSGYTIGIVDVPGHRDFVAALEKIRQPFNVNSLAQAAGLAALDDEAHTQKTRQNNAEGLKFLEDALREMGVEFVPSSANFVLLRVGEARRVFTELQSQGIIVRPVENYGLPEWLRISIGTPPQNRRCLRALQRILRKKP